MEARAQGLAEQAAKAEAQGGAGDGAASGCGFPVHAPSGHVVMTQSGGQCREALRPRHGEAQHGARRYEKARGRLMQERRGLKALLEQAVAARAELAAELLARYVVNGPCNACMSQACSQC